MWKIVVLLFSSIFLLCSGMVNAAPASKTWTFLVYLNGNNSLDDNGLENIKQMEKIGSNDQVNIVVQWASLDAQKTVRLLVLKDTGGKMHRGISSPVVEDLGNVDMGDVRTLDDFVRWGVEHYPADHYFVNVWNHGSGWHDVKKGKRGLSKMGSPGDISWDENTGNFITTEQLGQSMTRAAQVIGHKVDIVGTDACLMAMAEVVNEMSDSVGIFVGSQELEPASGWPYDTFLGHWQGTQNATAAQVAKYLVNDYVASYDDGDDVTLSAMDLSKMQDLDKALTTLGAALRQLNPIDKAVVFESAKKSQRFFGNDYMDLGDFIKRLTSMNIHNLDAQVLENVRTVMSEFIIANADSSRYKQSTGLSIWVPISNWVYDQYKDRYKGLKLSTASQWNETVDWFMQGNKLHPAA